MALRQLKAENILASGKRLGPADISPKLRDGRSATQGRPDWESGRPAGRECLRVWAAGYPGSMRSSADHIKERATVRCKRRGAQMSEAELHQIRLRLHQGERQKAARGELRLPLPAGLAYDRTGAIILNPDEEVQARLRLVFAKFRELQSVRSVMRYLRRNGLSLPVRPLLGPSPHEVVWRDADSVRVCNILRNPAYAGAYVYGRRQKDLSRCRPGSLTGTVEVAIADWAVCLKAAHPGYIGWEEFMANQRRMSDNASRYQTGHPGVPRQGSALLQGIAICGRCGRRMSLRYSGPRANYPVY